MSVAERVTSFLSDASSTYRCAVVPFDEKQQWCQMPSRSEEHTSELQSLMRISYAVFCLKKKNKKIRLSSQNNIKIDIKKPLNQVAKRIQHNLITHQNIYNNK